MTLKPPSKWKGKEYDSILVIVDRFTKLALYIPVTKKITAAELAEIFMVHVFRRFGAPAGMTSDRGSVFTSAFWLTFCWYLGVRRRLSTAFHPQTDGQTENMNQTLEHYLRCYYNYQQNDWTRKLSLAEFTYNSSRHSTTGLTPFFALMGYHPRMEIDARDSVAEREAPTAAQRIE